MRIDLPNPPQRVLIIKPSAIGDVVHTLPVLKLIRQRWPAARISWLLTPGCAGLLDEHPLLDEVILFDRRRYGRSWHDPRSLWGLTTFQRDLRRRRFDLVIDLQGLFRSGWLSFITRAPVRVGFSNARELAPLFYTHRVDPGSTEQHAIDRYLALAEALGCARGPVQFDFTVTPKHRNDVAALLGDVGRYAVLLPGSNWATKRWPVERYAELVEPLRERFGLEVVIAGGADDVWLGDMIEDVVNLTGKTSLPQLVALLSGAELVIANDSGPMHIAAALGKPLVALFGPTSHVRTGPYGREDTVLRLDIECSPCYSRRCSHRSCLRWLHIEPVLEAAARQLNVAAAASHP